MSESENKVCVVIGASHAGAQLAESTRKAGWEGKIIVIGDESYLPYHRPPLSKDFLAGKKSADDIVIKPASVYEKLDLEFRLNTRVTEINREKKELTLDDGSVLTYDKLGLALGARVRKVPIEGSDKKGVFYLRTIDDIENIRPYVNEGKNAVIVGGGYIGLETAAALRGLGMSVTVIEMMPRILQRVTAPDVSAFYHRVHTEEGVSIVTDAAVEAITGDESAAEVRCKDGQTFPAELVIIGAGILPNIELAKEAGLDIEENGAGILVDDYGQTSDADIVAAGDCTWHYNGFYDRKIRLESVPNAMDQARIAGAALNGNTDKPYKSLPWFWSDQFDMKLQIAGLSQGFDNVVVRGDIESSRQFAAFYFEGDKLLAVDAVNFPAAFMTGKRLLTSGTIVDKVKLADESVEFKELLK